MVNDTIPKAVQRAAFDSRSVFAIVSIILYLFLRTVNVIILWIHTIENGKKTLSTHLNLSNFIKNSSFHAALSLLDRNDSFPVSFLSMLFIFTKSHVKRPIQTVLYLPMRANITDVKLFLRLCFTWRKFTGWGYFNHCREFLTMLCIDNQSFFKNFTTMCFYMTVSFLYLAIVRYRIVIITYLFFQTALIAFDGKNIIASVFNNFPCNNSLCDNKDNTSLWC